MLCPRRVRSSAGGIRVVSDKSNSDKGVESMRSRLRLTLAVMLALAAVGILATAAAAAAPQNTSAPSISGTPKVGSTQTADNGTWSNTPTSFAYQWQRCASDGTACGDITAGTSKTYTPSSGDVGHALRVVVTAT